LPFQSANVETARPEATHDACEDGRRLPAAREGMTVARARDRSPGPMHILVLDRDAGSASLRARLEQLGFRATVLATPLAKIEDMTTVDGVLVAPQDPVEARAEHCRTLRENGYAGAIVACCADVGEGEALLEAGADDFVSATADALELAARLRACARRALARSRLTWGPLELDRMHRALRIRGRTIDLTERESDLLACLMEAGGRIVARSRLQQKVWPRTEDRRSNMVEVHLSRLRDKLGTDAAVIETVRRAGYRLRR
jgi:DNA-binding response OmpR family regulator